MFFQRLLKQYLPLVRKKIPSRALTRRPFSDFAFVFDIDGVLLRGSSPIPHAKEALSLLDNHNVPFILLTNGGGTSEAERAHKVSSILDFPIHELQIVQSHTPLKALASQNRYNRVLVVGGPGDKARQCALNYGFKDVLMPVDFVKYDPSVAPHHLYLQLQLESLALESFDISVPIDAVMVFNDPRDMGSDIQIVLDVLNSNGGLVGSKRQVDTFDRETPAVPLIFSNNDFLWANDYDLARFGQGAFRIQVEALYRELCGLHASQNLKSTILGKPFPVAYNYGHHVLIDWHQRLAGQSSRAGSRSIPAFDSAPTETPFKKIYMVGDNPASDIKGANDMGWESLLVRTGVYKESDGNRIVAHPTGGIFENVLGAVQYGISQAGK